MPVLAAIVLAGVLAAITMSGKPPATVHATGNYSDAVLADSPADYWRLGDSSCCVAADSSGNSRPGTYSGTGVAYGEQGALNGDSNTAVGLSGGYVSGPGVAFSGGTLEAWIYPTALPQYGGIVALGDLSGSKGGGIALQISDGTNTTSAGSELMLAYYYPSTTRYLDSGYAFPAANRWYHVVVTHPSSTAWAFYVNGQQTPGAPTLSIRQTDSTLVAGALASGSPATAPFSGSLDEVAEYTGVLSAGQVAAHYQEGADAVGGYGRWASPGPATVPAARADAAIAYDPAHSQVVMFGGESSAGAALSDTWLWNGSNWIQASPATVPGPRWGARMAYDAQTSTLVLFGGTSNGSSYLNDTWSWDGTTWTHLSPAASPSPRSDEALVYDITASSMVLFGGWTGSGGQTLADTWSWNGSTWAQLSPSTSPGARYGAGAAFDAARQQVVLFGGAYGTSGKNDTWTWNGSNWSQWSPSGAVPSARRLLAMAYDPATQSTLLSGGVDTSGIDSDTWTWNGSSWAQESGPAYAAPAARAAAGMAFDDASSDVVLFGGCSAVVSYCGTSTMYADTWNWNTPPAAPTGVSASAGNAQAAVNWSTPINGGSGITGFTVLATPGGQTASVGGTATSATITGLTNGTSYTFTVRATNAIGVSPWSGASPSITPYTVPAAPGSVTASAGIASDANVSWTAPANNGSVITQYVITPYLAGLAQTAVQTGGTGTTFDIGGLTCGSSYTFTVAAQNAAGVGPDSAQTSPAVTPNCVPGPAAGAAAVGGVNSDANLSWTAPAPNGGTAITQYVITPYLGGVAQAAVPTGSASTSFDITGLSCGSSYTFAVAAQNAAGNGPQSAQSSPAVTPNCAPGAPGTPTAAPGNLSAALGWSAPGGNGGSAVTDYLVTPYDDGSAQTAIDTGSTSTSYTVNGLTACHTYTFAISAKNSAGTGLLSAQSNSVPGPPTSPGDPLARPGPSSANVSWTQSTTFGCPVAYTVTPYVGSAAQTAKTPPSSALTATTLTGLSSSTTYTFQIVASNSLGSSAAATTPAITTSAPLASTGGNAAGQVGVFVGYADDWSGHTSQPQSYFPPLWPHRCSPGTDSDADDNGSTCVPDESASSPGDDQVDNGAVLVVNTTSQSVTISNVQVGIGAYSESWPEQLSGHVFAYVPTASFTLAPGDAEVVYDPNTVNNGGGDTSDVNGQINGPCTPGSTIPTVAVTVGGQTVTYQDSGQVLNTKGYDMACAGLNEGHNWVQIGGPTSAQEVLGKNESEKPCFVCTGDPVNTDNGNLTETYTDFTIAGHGVPLTFSRTYNSLQAPYDSSLGYGWSGSYNMALAQDPSTGNVIVHQEGGTSVTFTPPQPLPAPCSSATYTAPARVLATLTQNADCSFSFERNADQIAYVFNARGELISETDRFGYKTTLSYANDQLVTITDSEGRSLSLVYYTSGTSAGRLHTVTDSTGRQTVYAYSAAGDLVSVQDVGGGTTSFQYDPNHPHLLTQIKSPICSADTSGTCQGVNNVYDASGRVVQQTDNLGRLTSFDYSVAGQTTITDPKGHKTIDYYTNDQLVKETKGADSSSPQTWTYAYDPVTLGVTQVTDPPQPGQTDQTLHKSQWNTNGTLASQTLTDTSNTFSRTTQYVYYPDNEIQAETDPLGITTTYSRDAAHGYRLTSVATPYCAPANVSSCSGANVIATRTTAYAYTDSSHPDDVTQMTDPDGKVWNYAHDQYGNLTQVVDPAGDKTTWTYDALDRQTSRVSPNGYVSPNTPAQYTTTFNSYDAFGDLEQISDPLGHVTTYVWDANRNLLQQTDANNNVTAHAYDFDNEPVQTTKPDSTQQKPDVWKTTFDADGNVYQQIDGLGNTTAYLYDALNHLQSIQDPLQRTTSYSYNAVGELVSLTDAQSPAQTTTYSYDNAYELSGISYSDGRTANVGPIDYNADGQRIDMKDGSGTSTYSFDSLNRLAQSTDGAGQQLVYGYDLRGLVTSLAYPGGSCTTSPTTLCLTKQYDDAGRMQSISDWLGNTTTFGYDADSNLTSETLPGGTGVVDSFSFDRSDGMSAISDVKGSSTLFSASYTRDGDGQISNDSSAPAGLTGFGYSANNQLCYQGSASASSCSAPPSGATTYAYDVADNLTQKGGTSQTFDAADELCWAAATTGTCSSPPTGATTYVYDARGNRTSVTTSGVSTTLAYDQANRLISYTGPSTVAYAYNGDGLRVSKTEGTTTTGFAWDVSGGLPLLLKDGATAYIYGPGGLPLEQVSGSTVLWLHHDQIGSTRLITDASGTVQGAYTFDPYGLTTTSTGTVSNPFLFAGQYRDSESGLYYLRGRYYDPSTGQFISRDPLTATTRQPYSYVLDNPLNLKDPSGLDYSFGSGHISDAVWAGGDAALTDHYMRHGADFGSASEEEYAASAQEFYDRATQDDLPMRAAGGRLRFYDPESNTFGVYTEDGIPITFYKPTRGMAYWNDPRSCPGELTTYSQYANEELAAELSAAIEGEVGLAESEGSSAALAIEEEEEEP